VSYCLHCFVSGRVQGVWYRGSTRREAERLGLVGYARNLADGRVEVLACGKRQAVDELQEWLWQGPPAAEVTAVECNEVATPEPLPAGFATA